MNELQTYSQPESAVTDETLVERMTQLQHLPMQLVLEVPVADFTVGSLVSLKPGDILTTAAQQNEDLSLQVNGQPVGPVKFDVTGENLAVRLTGIA